MRNEERGTRNEEGGVEVSPIIFVGIITLCCVWAMSMKVNVQASASTSQMVREVPSMQINPLGTMYLMDVGGTLIWGKEGKQIK